MGYKSLVDFFEYVSFPLSIHLLCFLGFIRSLFGLARYPGPDGAIAMSRKHLQPFARRTIPPPCKGINPSSTQRRRPALKLASTGHESRDLKAFDKLALAQLKHENLATLVLFTEIRPQERLLTWLRETTRDEKWDSLS